MYQTTALAPVTMAISCRLSVASQRVKPISKAQSKNQSHCLFHISWAESNNTGTKTSSTEEKSAAVAAVKELKWLKLPLLLLMYRHSNRSNAYTSRCIKGLRSHFSIAFMMCCKGLKIKSNKGMRKQKKTALWGSLALQNFYCRYSGFSCMVEPSLACNTILSSSSSCTWKTSFTSSRSSNTISSSCWPAL